MNIVEPLMLVLGAVAIAMALLVVHSRSLVYSAAFLGFLGLANASLFAILGYGLVAIIHVLVYVGAAVLFIVLAVTMMREPAKQYTNLLMGLASGLLFFAVVLGFFWTSSKGLVIMPVEVKYSEIVDYFFSSARPAVVILAISLAAALIGSIHIARSEKVR